MSLSPEQETQFDNATLNDKRILVDQLRILGADLTVALGAIDAMLLLLSTKGYLPDGGNPLTDEDLADSGLSAADIFAAVGAISAIATDAKDPVNNWTAHIGKIVQANRLRSASR